MSATVAIFVPMVLFMVFVAPIWVVMHYRSVNRSSRSLCDEDRACLEDMLSSQGSLIDRIAVLESLLDTKDPTWRRQERV